MYPLGHVAAACGTAWLAKRKLGRGATGGAGRWLDRVDYRAVAFGALLPDLIDKPLIWIVLRDSEFGGHHVGHSLLFTCALALVGIVLRKRGSEVLLLVSFGAFTHVLFDSVTHVPWSLLYPFMELDVPRKDIVLAVTNIAGEVIASAALAFFLLRPRRRTRIAHFFRDGSIEV